MTDSRAFTTATVIVTLVLVLVLSSVGLSRVRTRWDERHAAIGSGFVSNEPATGPGPTDDVSLIGDSITEQSEPVLHQVLDPTFKVRVRGRGGYRIEELEPYAIELATTKPEQVVINLGTNDVLKNWPVQKATAAMNRMVTTFKSARCVYIVTITEGMRSEIDPNQSARALVFNLELRRIAAAHNVRIIDWAALIRDDAAAGSPRGALTSDTVHPTEEGRRRLAELYREALTGCS